MKLNIVLGDSPLFLILPVLYFYSYLTMMVLITVITNNKEQDLL